ncbi:MAG TPA: cache domain-containing protein [Deltaproteobacteria bacterium]|nr:cache domain-containing protein [Deltaproteobacteria bacterium]
MGVLRNLFEIVQAVFRLTSLRTRISVLVLATAMTVLLSASVYIGNHAVAMIEQNYNQQLSSTNRTLSTAVTVWLEIHLKILENLVSIPDIISMEPARQKPILQSMGAAFPYMYLVSTTNLNGMDVARNDQGQLRDYSDREWFQKARRGDPVTYETLVSKTVNRSAIAFSKPIKNSRREIVGVGMFSLDLDNLARQVRVTQVGKSGFAYVVGPKNRVIAHPDHAYVSELRDLGDYPPVAALRKGVKGQFSFVDVDGKRWRSHISMLDNGWGIIVQQLETELLEAQFLFQKVAFFVILLAAVILFAVTWWALRRALNSVELLSTAVSNISTGDMSHPDFEHIHRVAGAIHTHDEVGTLAESFNNMAVKLEGTLASLEQELSERKQIELSLRENEEKYRSLVDNVNIGVYRSSPELDGHFIQANPAMVKMLGYDSAEEFLNIPASVLYQNPQDRRAYMDEIRERGFVKDKELNMKKKDGTPVICAITGAAQFDDQRRIKWVDGVIEDITEIKRADLGRGKLEEQLRQSQKMETVGLLAGGIAHDFNNLLTPILGYTELLLNGFPEEDPRHRQVESVLQAAVRARGLTQRLLAFSRKQVIELKQVDMGELIRRFENMLRSTIRENIAIEVNIARDCCFVMADAGQIEQVLVNLSVNAQDAMPSGGRLLVEVDNVELDEGYTSLHQEIAPGSYVVLSVSDTGNGIDKDTINHIFEPFFTTKELGKGTGLGLSTVYGIVKQHNGSINVYSEPGQGTVFKVFLPRVSAEGHETEHRYVETREHKRGEETILVVEDSDMVRLLTCDVLSKMGYNVLVAETPLKGLELSKEHDGAIDLLLTDVVMPEMNGKSLYEKLIRQRKSLKVIYMSGYSGNIITDHGILHEDTNFIQKPFSIQTLADKVRQVLDS